MIQATVTYITYQQNAVDSNVMKGHTTFFTIINDRQITLQK